jgi:hypothetical protein
MTDQSKTVSTSSLLHENRTFPPSAEAAKRAHINTATYAKMYERSLKDSDAFWLEQCDTLEWFKSPRSDVNTWDTRRGRFNTHGRRRRAEPERQFARPPSQNRARAKTSRIQAGRGESEVQRITYGASRRPCSPTS